MGRVTLKEHQYLYVRSMGKAVRVTAIETDEDKANARMARTNDAVMAVFGPFILLADKGDMGITIPQEVSR